MYSYIVIDDEELTRKGTIAKLKTLDSYVTCIGEASDGAQALNLLQKADPDIIITDMNMPNMDGTALLPKLAVLYPEKPIIVISGYKDFEYTKHAIKAKAIDYLLKPFSREDIQNSIKSAINILENNALIQNRISSSETDKENACYEYDIQTLKNAILGYHSDKITILSKKLSHMNSTYQYVLMTMHTTGLLDETDMHGYLASNGFGDLALYLQHSNNEHLASLILFMPEQSVLSPNLLCQKTAQNIINSFKTTDISISVGVSNPQTELTHLNQAYNETVQALNEKRTGDQNEVYFFQDNDPNITHIKWDREDELLFRIEAGMTNEASSLIHNLFQYLGTYPHLRYSDIKYYCFQLSDSIRSIMANYIEQVSASSVSSSMQNVLSTMYDLSELEAYYLQLFTNVSGILYEKGFYSHSDLIDKVKLYTQKNYYKNLTVELLASFFYVNRSYLSHTFREKTGEKYVDYLNNIRINKAKILLETTDKKMYQIAKSVGYDNVKYFFRVFKKTTDKTPEQWRRDCQ